MASGLFDRACRLTVYRAKVGEFTRDQDADAVVIEGLRIAFAIERNLRSEPSRGEIEIANAGEGLRRFLTRKPATVILEAGYVGDLRRLYQGDLVYGASRLDGPTWLTTLQLGDGDRIYRHARVRRGYGRGVKIGTVLADAARSVGLSLPADFAASDAANAELATGAAVSAPFRDVFTAYLAGYGYSWSIQDGRLVILPDGVALAGQTVKIDERAGLVGSPELEAPDKAGGKPRLTATTLLYPGIAPGQAISVTSAAVSGTFRVERLTHRGDTHGQDWTTEMEASPL